MERYRIESEAAVYFVSFSVVDWLPVFISEAACLAVTESLDYCRQHKFLRINAYVIMPTHLHLILFDRDFDAARLAATIADFRKFTARSLLDLCSRQLPACFTETFRRAAAADRERRFWQPSRHPEAIYSEPFWRQKLDYLHENPRRKGLVLQPDHWRFSSAAYYYSDGQVRGDVTIDAIDWT